MLVEIARLARGAEAAHADEAAAPAEPTLPAEAARRFKRSHPRLANITEAEIAEADLSLADAQWVIAREHAFESWPKFVKHIQELVRTGSPVSRFLLSEQLNSRQPRIYNRCGNKEVDHLKDDTEQVEEKYLKEEDRQCAHHDSGGDGDEQVA